MSDTGTIGDGARDGAMAALARKGPGGRWFIALCLLVALAGLFPWMLAAAFAPALLGAPGPSPSPLTILGIAAVLSYPIWLIYWGLRAISARRAGRTGVLMATVAAVPAVFLLSAFSLMNFAP